MFIPFNAARDGSHLNINLRRVSKQMCSCLFVENGGTAFCAEKVKMRDLNAKIDIDYVNKMVKVKSFLFYKQTAHYRNKKYGCQVER